MEKYKWLPFSMALHEIFLTFIKTKIKNSCPWKEMKTKIRFVFSVNSTAVLHANGEEGRGTCSPGFGKASKTVKNFFI